MKVGAFAPSEVDYVSELTKGRFSVTANVNHKSKFATCKVRVEKYFLTIKKECCPVCSAHGT